MAQLSNWLRSLPGIFTIIASLFACSLWAASHYFVTHTDLDLKLDALYVEQLEDKLHELDTNDRESLKKYYARKRDRLLKQ